MRALRRPVAAFALMALVAQAGACRTTQVYPGPRRARNEVALIGSGDATIYAIDGVGVPKASWYEVLPGGHTMDLTAEATTPGFMVTTFHRSGLTSVCLKAKAGRSYKVKATARDGRMRVFVIDTDTGGPPKTPCGPDEDEE
jgi:hypothetical protein